MAWSSWSELEESYKNTVTVLKEAREKLDDSEKFRADREILGSIIGDVTEISRIIKQKVLYEFGSLSEDELALLTDRQREVAELRQRYNYYQIAQMTGLRADEVFHIFQQAVAKIKKIKRQRENNIPLGLSPQQEKIYILYKQGKKSKEIAEMIGSDYRSVHTQLKRIIKKVDKTIQ